MREVRCAELVRGGSVRGRCPADYSERTLCEMLTLKHTLLIAEKIKKEGDFVSDITDVKSLSNFTESSKRAAYAQFEVF